MMSTCALTIISTTKEARTMEGINASNRLIRVNQYNLEDYIEQKQLLDWAAEIWVMMAMITVVTSDVRMAFLSLCNHMATHVVTVLLGDQLARLYEIRGSLVDGHTEMEWEEIHNISKLVVIFTVTLWIVNTLMLMVR